MYKLQKTFSLRNVSFCLRSVNMFPCQRLSLVPLINVIHKLNFGCALLTVSLESNSVVSV